jgi:LysM domain.
MGIYNYVIRPGDTIWFLALQYNTTISEIAAVNPGLDLENLYVGQVICMPPRFSYYPHGSFSNTAGVSKAEADLNNRLRMLWEQHVVWTRLVIMSIVFNLPDLDLATNRLLRNPKDFEAVLKPLYGDKAAARFADLFTKHLTIAAQLVKASKAGDTKAAADAEKTWYSNTDEIAAFLGSINPYWSEKEWKDMLHEHLALTKSEAVNLLTKNFGEGISTFDKIEQQALKMADVMRIGIVSQFPDKFMG